MRHEWGEDGSMTDAPDDVTRWFEERGFTALVHNEAGVWWVDLMRDDAGAAVVRQYGRGENPEAALESAQHRWRVEQDGE